MTPSTLPSSGARCIERTRWARLRSITSCTSSSRSICAAELIAVGGAARDRPRVGGLGEPLGDFAPDLRASACGARSRRARGSCAARTRRACGRRDLFVAGTIAVCGIGMPSGWRKSAVTANQSARPPTIAASIVARTMPSHGHRGSSARVTTKTTVAATSSSVARRFIESSCAWRVASSCRICIARGPAGVAADGRPSRRGTLRAASRTAATRRGWSGGAFSAPGSSPRRHLDLAEVDEVGGRARWYVDVEHDGAPGDLAHVHRRSCASASRSGGVRR